MLHEVLIRTSSGRHRFTIDDDFCNSLSVPVGEHNEEGIKLFVASWLSLLADSPLDPENKPYFLYRKFLERICRDGIKATVSRFTDLAHQLVSRQTVMGSGSSIGDWIGDFKDTPVFFEYNRYFKTGDVKLLGFLYTFLNFGKKLEFVDSEFNKAAFSGWLDVEKRLDGLDLLEEDTSALKRILQISLPTFSWTDLRPKFGPGRVQERGVKGRIGKLRSLSYDALIDRFLLHGHIGFYGDGGDLGVCAHKIIPDPERWTSARGTSSRAARLRFVPKSLKVSRTICMEPNTLMFFQQAVLREFLKLLDKSLLSNFIDIRDQSRNRDLSLRGSYTTEIDTIDLSAASDSLSAELVRRVFPSSWLIPMMVTRSSSVILPDGSERAIKKFAPMGSALCFPTQCIIFASVCIYAACRRTYELQDRGLPFLDWLTDANICRVIASFGDDVGYTRFGFQPMAIYGDDICVDGCLTNEVKAILGRLGFVVNDSKSFTGAQSFRESCGGYYLNGHDVTPVYYKVEQVRAKLTPSHVVSQVHLINEAWNRGYRNLYRFLHNSLMTWGCRPRLRNKAGAKNAIPYVSDIQDFGILVREPKNSHLQTREHPDYQRTEIRCWTTTYDYRVEPGDSLSLVDSYEYMRWWPGRDRHTSEEPNPSVSRTDTGGPGLRWSWIPAK